MKQFEHGGNFPDGILDFSVNINPFGMPESVKKILAENIGRFSEYPDPDCVELVQKLSEYEKVQPRNIVCGNGAADLIYRLVRALKPCRALLTSPTFSEYERALKLLNTDIFYYELREEEQFQVYKRVVQRMAGRRVIICTLDIGADKQVDYFNLKKEENPALGYRAIRICLTRPEIFKTQLRALYRASVFGNLGIMFPMITSVSELEKIVAICEEVKSELKSQGAEYSDKIELGIMIETPASVLVAEELAKEVDFFSVGTNDLTQYTLACDRQANDLGKFFDPHHPAVLRALKIAADAAHKAGIWIGICGELGADLSLTETFLKMGVDELSVSPAMVLRVRKIIRETDTSK